MTETDARRAHAFAWLVLSVHIGAHVAEEALTGFLDVWNPVLASLRQRYGLPLPDVTYGEWLTILIIAVVGLIGVTPLVARGLHGLVPASYALAVLMIANGANHLLSPLYLGRFLPGQFTSPFLILASIWLIVRTWQVSHPGALAAHR